MGPAGGWGNMSTVTGPGAVESRLLTTPPLAMDTDSIVHDFTHYFRHTLGHRVLSPGSPFVYRALALALRDRLIDRLNRTSAALEAENSRQACYMSLEYLMGRLLRNAVMNLGLEDACEEAFQRLGLSYADVLESEHDTGLGNGGLGRLAACFLDSCATLRLPVLGYGIRYRYGMFRQLIENGQQVEEPDKWLDDGFPWEIGRNELTQRVRFGGRTEQYTDALGATRYRWIDTHDVLAVPFDVPVPGYRNDCVNTLRLWRAKATDAFDLDEFHAGSYTDSVAAKTAAENITMVLYPNAANESGKELRLRQQYFLASASLQDCMRQWSERHGCDFRNFEQKFCFQLNDTHPAIAVAELMRLLLDEHGVAWERAWEITRKTMAYTNHTLLPEALETWPVAMLEHLLPRLLQIILEINARFLNEVSSRWPGESARWRAMSLIEEGPEPVIRMAYLAIVGSFSVNGVAELHSRLLRQGLFRDFAELWPDKFNSKTNGVTPRRWLAACNSGLADLITQTIGESWVTDLEQLHELAAHAEDESFRRSWRQVKRRNKIRLSRFVEVRTGVAVDPQMIFDVQVKRIHEYKRQALNVLHAIHLYDRIKRGETDELAPRAIILGGKAAPGYRMAKEIIKFANNVAAVINEDPETDGLLRFVFVPDYNVSAMELICPAADISAQISTAGKEASGTGNMKFMMNGAITVGTLDGANVEIREAVGPENFFLFGLTVDEVASLRAAYEPESLIAGHEDLRRVFDLIDSGAFNSIEPGIFDDVVGAMRSPSDPWMTVADAPAYFAAQRSAAATYRDVEAWTRMSILNTAASGRFSADRTIQAYNEEIWRLQPLEL
jgi:starch phosphorylase